jgi:hypothetical protein
VEHATADIDSGASANPSNAVRLDSTAELSGRALIVGITPDRAAALIEDFDPGSRRILIRLPSLDFDVASVEGLSPQLAGRLPAEIGYTAGELVPMSSHLAGGQRAASPFFLAPRLTPATWRARIGFMPGVREIPLATMRAYLSRRLREGAVVTPAVRRGLVLAEEFFPQWARQLLCRAIELIERGKQERGLA